MDLRKLNSLDKAYREEKSEENFRHLYEEASRIFLKVNRARYRKVIGADDNDADEVFDEVLLKLAGDPNVKDFGRMFSRSLLNAFKDFSKVTRRRLNRLEWDELSDDVDSGPLVDEPPNVKCIAVEDSYPVLEKNIADQKYLVDYICESAKIQLDPITAATVDLIKDDAGMTLNAIAKSLGLGQNGRNIVARRIERLSRHLPANCYILDFMPKDHEIKREFLSA